MSLNRALLPGWHEGWKWVVARRWSTLSFTSTPLLQANHSPPTPFFGPPWITPCVSMAWCMSNNCCKNTPQFRAPQCQWVVACLGTQVGYIANYTNNYVGEWRSQHYTMPTIIENKRVSANFRVRFHLKITRSQRFQKVKALSSLLKRMWKYLGVHFPA